MRYPASEKLEIIRLVEQSALPIRRTLDQLGIPKSTFYAWYDRYQTGGVGGGEKVGQGSGSELLLLGALKGSQWLA